jgi:uncharacterized membrane protein
MQRKTRRIELKTMVLVGVLSALVFALSLVQIPFGDISRIHMGNVMCVLSGILFGPWAGGLSAGLGSMLYDFTDPRFMPEFWLTFIMKFAMGFLAGALARKLPERLHSIPRALLAALAGQLLYIALFLCRSAVLTHFVNGVPWDGTWVALATSAVSSLINGSMTVVACTLLGPPLGAALTASGLFKAPPKHSAG